MGLNRGINITYDEHSLSDKVIYQITNQLLNSSKLSLMSYLEFHNYDFEEELIHTYNQRELVQSFINNLWEYIYKKPYILLEFCLQESPNESFNMFIYTQQSYISIDLTGRGAITISDDNQYTDYTYYLKPILSSLKDLKLNILSIKCEDHY